MNWFDAAQIAGYLGIACNGMAALLISYSQRASAFQWTLALLGDVAWVSFAVLSGQGAALVDVGIFIPIHLLGVWRYARGVR